jgi:hypothetical protein
MCAALPDQICLASGKVHLQDFGAGSIEADHLVPTGSDRHWLPEVIELAKFVLLIDDCGKVHVGFGPDKVFNIHRNLI